MRKALEEHRKSSASYHAYVTGFVLSVLITLTAYVFVVNGLWSNEVLTYIIMALAVVQLVVQLVFFLHLGKGSAWKLVTLLFALLVVLIVVIGSLWIMYNLDYNMMHMSPEQMHQYMEENEGI